MNNQTHNTTVNKTSDIEIDFINLLRIMWGKLWLIILSMILCGAMAFSVARFFVPAKYTASAMMYVNNSVSVGGSTISFSSSQLSAAKSLLDVYVIILKSRPTLEEVIDKAGLDISSSELRSMISASSVNSTEIFKISATCADKEEAALIVNTIVEVLPDRITYVVEGSSVKEVEKAEVPKGRSSPSYTKYAAIGILVGFAISTFSIVLEDILNTSVRDEEYLKTRYSIPVLAVVPELFDPSNKSYSRRYSYKYGYRNRFRYRYRYRYKYQMYEYHADASMQEAEETANTAEKGGVSK